MTTSTADASDAIEEVLALLDQIEEVLAELRRRAHTIRQDMQGPHNAQR